MNEKRDNWENLWENRIEASRAQEVPDIDVRDDVLHLLRAEGQIPSEHWDSILVDFFTQRQAWAALGGIAALVLFMSIFAFNKGFDISQNTEEDALYAFIDNGNWTDLL